jgi:electron transfer flavoprotein beta subunit
MAASRKPLKIESADVKYPEDSAIISNLAPESSRKRILFEDVAKGVNEISKVLKS